MDGIDREQICTERQERDRRKYEYHRQIEFRVVKSSRPLQVRSMIRSFF